MLPTLGLTLDKSVVLGPDGFEFLSGAQNVLERGTQHPGVGLVSSSQPGFLGLLGVLNPVLWLGEGRDRGASFTELTI